MTKQSTCPSTDWETLGLEGEDKHLVFDAIQPAEACKYIGGGIK